jgi:hypothetical protein
MRYALSANRNACSGVVDRDDSCPGLDLGRGFIMVQVPTDRQTNFGNQRFAPNGKQ